MQDNRLQPRHRTLKAGRVVFHGSSTLDCVIRDLSATGAKLRFADPVRLPADLQLIIIGQNQQFRVRQTWQRGSDIGVEFAPET